MGVHSFVNTNPNKTTDISAVCSFALELSSFKKIIRAPFFSFDALFVTLKFINKDISIIAMPFSFSVCMYFITCVIDQNGIYKVWPEMKNHLSMEESIGAAGSGEAYCELKHFRKLCICKHVLHLLQEYQRKQPCREILQHWCWR